MSSDTPGGGGMTATTYSRGRLRWENMRTSRTNKKLWWLCNHWRMRQGNGELSKRITEMDCPYLNVMVTFKFQIIPPKANSNCTFHLDCFGVSTRCGSRSQILSCAKKLKTSYHGPRYALQCKSTSVASGHYKMFLVSISSGCWLPLVILSRPLAGWTRKNSEDWPRNEKVSSCKRILLPSAEENQPKYGSYCPYWCLPFSATYRRNIILNWKGIGRRSSCQNCTSWRCHLEQTIISCRVAPVAWWRRRPQLSSPKLKMA